MYSTSCTAANATSGKRMHAANVDINWIHAVLCEGDLRAPDPVSACQPSLAVGQNTELLGMHVAILNEAVAAFALRDKLIIWHALRDKNGDHKRMVVATDPCQGIILEHLCANIVGLKWIVPANRANAKGCSMPPYSITTNSGVLMVSTSCGWLRLFDMYMSEICARRITTSCQGPAIDCHTTALGHRGFMFLAQSSITTIQAAALERLCVQRTYMSSFWERTSSLRRHDVSHLIHHLHLPPGLRRCTGAAYVISSNSFLNTFLAADTERQAGLEPMAVLTTGEGPAMSWLSCFAYQMDVVPESRLNLSNECVGKSNIWTRCLGGLMHSLSLTTQVLQTLMSRWMFNTLSVDSVIADDRSVDSLCLAPDQLMAACVDEKGRVLLVDTASKCIIRVWKGYRDAHLGWVVAPVRESTALVAGHAQDVKVPVAMNRKTPTFLSVAAGSHRRPACAPRAKSRGGSKHMYLVIYAPKCGVLELWPPRMGAKVRSYKCSHSCRLLRTVKPHDNFDTFTPGPNAMHVEFALETDCMLLDMSCGRMFRISSAL
eukprot:jgi/Ulvmu1/4173/UM019_0152.1